MTVTLKEIEQVLRTHGYNGMADDVLDRNICLPFWNPKTGEACEWPVADLVESGTPIDKDGDDMELA